MEHGRQAPVPRPRMSRAGLLRAAACAIGILAALAFIAQSLIAGQKPGIALVGGALGIAYIAGGTLAWQRRPDYLIGPLLVLSGYLSMLNALYRFDDIAGLWTLAWSFYGVHLAIQGYVVLTYPSGRPTRTVWSMVGIAVVAIATGESALRLLTHPGVHFCANGCIDVPNPFLIVNLGETGAVLSTATLPLLTIAVAIAAIVRFLSARGAARRALTPMLVAGLLGAAALLVAIVLRPAPDDETAFLIVRSFEVLIPVALTVGFLRSRMARAGVADLVTTLGPAPTSAELEAAVRRALHDPSARLLTWSALDSGYRSAAGEPAQPGVETHRHASTHIDAAGSPVAVLEHDPVLAEEGDLIAAVSAAVSIVLRNASLSTAVRRQADEVRSLPTGRVTLILTDVEDSTTLLDRLRDRYVDLISELRRMQRSVTLRWGGAEVDSRADEFFAAFPDAGNGANAAIEMQERVAATSWPDGVTVRIRLGIHTGEPVLAAEGYVGMDVHAAARVSAAAHGGQIVASDAAHDAIDSARPGLSFIDLGTYRLKGVPDQHRLYQLATVAPATAYPPLRAERADGEPLAAV